jgi:hypothetical protein
LAPRFDAHIDDSTELIIAGGDGSYLTLDRGLFSAILKRWLNIGCKISYLLVDPDKKYFGPFVALGEKFDHFSVHCIWTTALSNDDPLRSKVESMRTVHFVLMQRSDNARLMWIENYHPPRSLRAYDVEFVDSDDAAGTARSTQFEMLWGLAKEVLEHPKALRLRARSKKDPGYKLSSDAGVLQAIKKL